MTKMSRTVSPIWEQQSFLKRQWELRSEELSSLYPSQAWCLYRMLANCESVLDIGFGSYHSAAVVQSIKPMRYVGLDSSKAVIEAAQPHASATTRFEYGDIMNVPLKERFDAVMGWSLTYALPDPYALIEKMWDATDNYLMFDVRAVHGAQDIIDMDRAYGIHDGERCHYSIFGWDKLCAFLKQLTPEPARIEFCSYYFPVSRNVVLDKSVPEPFVAAIVLHKSGEKAEMKGALVPPLKPAGA